MSALKEEIEREIQKLASLSHPPLRLTDHVRVQMEERCITLPMLLEALKNGVIRTEPEPDIKTGHMKYTMQRKVAGKLIKAVVSLTSKGKSKIVVITVMKK